MLHILHQVGCHPLYGQLREQVTGNPLDLLGSTGVCALESVVDDTTVSGVTGASCSAVLSYAEPGVYIVKVTMTDKDGGMPTGNTEFNFKAGDLNFVTAYVPDESQWSSPPFGRRR